MSWSWRYEGANGEPIEASELPTPEFPTQADAESWLGGERTDR